MTFELATLALAGIVLLGYAMQTVTGFGSILLCVTLGAHFMPVREVVTLLVPLSLLQTGYITLRHADGVRWRLIGIRVLPLACLGMAVGMLAARRLEGSALLVVFAVMVLALSARELWVLAGARRGAIARPISGPAAAAALVSAGTVHGIYATGGPLLVYAIGRAGLAKHEFRSTLSAIWLILNAALAAGFLLEGRYDAAVARDLLLLAPAIPAGVALGEVVHRRVDEHGFKVVVFSLIAAAAVSLLIR